MKASVRATTTITYHGRSGKPKLHWTQTGSPFIMVRAKGGGVKRLYLETAKAKREITEGFTSLFGEARRKCRVKVGSKYLTLPQIKRQAHLLNIQPAHLGKIILRSR